MLPDSIPVAMTVAPATAALAEFLTIPTIVPDDTLTVGPTTCWAITGNAQVIMDAETKRLRRQVSIFITSSLPFFRCSANLRRASVRMRPRCGRPNDVKKEGRGVRKVLRKDAAVAHVAYVQRIAVMD
jgi:hypothetical protein